LKKDISRSRAFHNFLVKEKADTTFS